MATASRGTTASVEDDLVSSGHDFTFFQAMHLLRLLIRRQSERENPAKLRIRPDLSLAFPCSDIARICRTDNGYEMVVTFLGLYGHSSPLPSFYTQQLLDEETGGIAITREFLDIINHRFYILFYDCQMKYRLFMMGGEHDLNAGDLLFCLMGAVEGASRIPEPSTLLKYSGLFALRSRSADGLATLLTEALQVPVKVIQCVMRRMPVPVDQLLRLGEDNSTLGEDALVGSEIFDRTGKFRISIGPVALGKYAELFPGTPGRQLVDALVTSYIKTALLWDVEIIIAAGEVPAATLGSMVASRLGWDCWIAPEDTKSQSALFPASFPPVILQPDLII